MWDAGACVTDAESVHPPKAGEPWRAWLDRAAAPAIIEVMYPGYELGTGDEVERAMADQLVLAVDISHVFIQLDRRRDDRRDLAAARRPTIGSPRSTSRRIAARSTRINRSRADTFGLAWARERGAHVPLVLECYMHRLSDAQTPRAARDLDRERMMEIRDRYLAYFRDTAREIFANRPQATLDRARGLAVLGRRGERRGARHDRRVGARPPAVAAPVLGR